MSGIIDDEVCSHGIRIVGLQPCFDCLRESAIAREQIRLERRDRVAKLADELASREFLGAQLAERHDTERRE